MDGFDSYTTLADLSTEYVSSPYTFSTTGGRYGGGAPSVGVSLALGKFISPLTELWCGFAMYPTAFGTTAATLLSISGGSGKEFAVVYNGGAIKFYRGTGNDTLVQTTAVTAISLNTWHWMEFRYKYHASTGVCEVWCDGVQLASYSGNTTSSGSGSVSFILIGSTIGNSYNWSGAVDDLYILDATTGSNTTRLGDSRIETLLPTGNGAANNGTCAGSIPFSFSTATTLNTGVSDLSMSPAIAAPYTGTLSGVAVNVSAAVSSGAFSAAIYDSAGNNVLATATPLSAMAAGWNTFTFVTPLSVTAGTQYRIALWQNTSYAVYVSATGGNWVWKAVTYTGTFPTNPGPSTSENPVNFSWVYSPVVQNWSYVNDFQWDVTGYVTITGTSNQEELYTIGALSSAAYVVSGVRLVAIDQKLDAGPSLLKMVAVSSGSEGASAGIPTLTSWSRQYAILETDPHTSAAWTAAAVNAAQYGVKVA